MSKKKLNKKEEYIRIRTTYYKIIQKPNISGDFSESRIRWSRETIIEDEGRGFLSSIRKYDDFVCFPSHTDFQKEIGNCINTYGELKQKPSDTVVLEEEIPHTLQFFQHIFGSQYELGLDYFSILYRYPIQILPIVCLVSRERSTGKSTFIKWLKSIFCDNMTYIKGDNFQSAFNSDWASKLIIAIDEVFIDNQQVTESLKFLSTSNSNKIEAKGKDREEIPFFGIFILCSNNEIDFIKIQPEETRFWVRKIIPFSEKEDTNFLSKLEKEIPFFLRYILDRPISTPKTSRMWFSPEEIRTKALERLMLSESTQIKTDLLDLCNEIFESINEEFLYACPLDLCSNLQKMYRRKYLPNDIRKILYQWGFIPQNNSLSYKGYELTSFGSFVEIDRKGRYFAIERKKIKEIFDALMQE